MWVGGRPRDVSAAVGLHDFGRLAGPRVCATLMSCLLPDSMTAVGQLAVLDLDVHARTVLDRDGGPRRSSSTGSPARAQQPVVVGGQRLVDGERHDPDRLVVRLGETAAEGRQPVRVLGVGGRVELQG